MSYVREGLNLGGGVVVGCLCMGTGRLWQRPRRGWLALCGVSVGISIDQELIGWLHCLVRTCKLH